MSFCLTWVWWGSIRSPWHSLKSNQGTYTQAVLVLTMLPPLNGP